MRLFPRPKSRIRRSIFFFSFSEPLNSGGMTTAQTYAWIATTWIIVNLLVYCNLLQRVSQSQKRLMERKYVRFFYHHLNQEILWLYTSTIVKCRGWFEKKKSYKVCTYYIIFGKCLLLNFLSPDFVLK